MPRPSLAALSVSRVALPPLRTFSWEATSTPTGVTFARTGTVLVLDNAAQTHLTSYGANTWSPEHDTGSSYYQYNVPGYVNVLTTPRVYNGGSGTWLSGTVAIIAQGDQDGPDGSSLTADWCSATSTQYGPYYADAGSAQYVYSGWGRSNSGTATWQCGLWAADGSTRLAGFATTVTTTWQRQTAQAAAVKYLIPVDGRYPSAIANSVAVDCQMLVAGITYAPPYTDGTVGGTSYSVAGSDFVAGSGRFDVDLGTITALEAATTPGADQYLVYWDASNHLKLRASDRKFVLTLAGSAVAVSAAQSYAAGTSLGACRVWSLGTGCGFTIGGTTTSAGAVSASSVPTTVYLGSTGSASHFPCTLAGTYNARSV